MTRTSTTASSEVVSDNTDAFSQDAYTQSLDQLASLRTTALSGRISHALELSIGSVRGDGDWLNVADAPQLWPVLGKVTSSFGERSGPVQR